MVSWIFLSFTVIAALLAYNVWYPAYAPGKRAVASFLFGWLTGELALHAIAFQVLVTLFFVYSGVLRSWSGILGLGILLVTWVGLWRAYWASSSAGTVIEQALSQGLGPGYQEEIRGGQRPSFDNHIDWKPIVQPFPIRHPEVERIRNLKYTRAAGLDLRLDVYRRRSHPNKCPVLLQVHGGGWCLGSKNEQGVPLMVHMARHGWACVSVDYRLSPHATFPDHLVDIKRSIAWIHEHGEEYGLDPAYIVVTGGSAGGHLSALTALTPNAPEYQPGFEDVDTRVQGCVPFYGVYDFTDRYHTLRNGDLLRLLEKRVMKASREEAPEAYEKASPIAQVRADAPPFLVIHGDHDTLVPVAQARHFVSALRNVSQSPVLYAEVPGAQHAFEIFPSLRTAQVVQGVERFLAWLHSRYVAGENPTPAQGPAT